MRSEVTYVCGYPRSGNSWMRFIVAGLVYNVYDVRAVDGLIPDVNKPTERDFAKTHRIDVVGNHRCIYVVRNPLDVCVSAYYYKMLKSGKTKRDAFVAEFIESHGNPDWIKTGFGTWNEHVHWAIKRPKDRLMLRYEDMCANPQKAICLIAGFLGIKSPDIDTVLQQTSFDVMKQQEEWAIRKKHESTLYSIKRHGYKKTRFLRYGKPGGSEKFLLPGEREAMIDAFWPEMMAMEYL